MFSTISALLKSTGLSPATVVRNIWQWNKPPAKKVTYPENLSLSYYSYKPEYLIGKDDVVKGVTAPPIIALHGLYTSKSYFYDLAASLALRLHRQVYLLDCANHGESPQRQFDGKATMMMLSQDVLNFMDEFKVPKALLLGYGLGGRVMVQCAQLYEPRVEKVITVDISQDGPYVFSKNMPKYLNYLKDVDSEDNGAASLTYVRLVMKEILRSQVKSPLIMKYLLDNIRVDSQGKYQWRFNTNVLEQMLAHWSTIKQIAYSGKQCKSIKVLNILSKNNFITSEDYYELRNAFRICTIQQIGLSGRHRMVDKGPKPTLAKAIAKFADSP